MGQDERQRDEAHIRRLGADRLRDFISRVLAGIALLDGDHPGVVAQSACELPVPDIHRVDFGRAALQQHLCKATGRGADVEGRAPLG